MAVYRFSNLNRGLYGLYKSICTSSNLLVIFVILLSFLIVLVDIFSIYSIYSLLRTLISIIWWAINFSVILILSGLSLCNLIH